MKDPWQNSQDDEGPCSECDPAELDGAADSFVVSDAHLSEDEGGDGLLDLQDMDDDTGMDSLP